MQETKSISGTITARRLDITTPESEMGVDIYGAPFVSKLIFSLVINF